MRRISTYSIFVATMSLLLVLSACNGSKALMKDAMTYQSSGDYAQAVRAYQLSLDRKFDNELSRQGLGEAGRIVIDSKLSDFGRFRSMGREKEAVNAFIEVEAMRNRFKRYRVDLEVPNFFYEEYDEVKESYLSKVYQEADNALGLERFDEAQRLLDEVLRVDGNYRDTQEMRSTATLEPKYRDAVAALDAGYYRDAYYTFRSLNTGSGLYKDAAALRDEALNLGTFTIALMPFEATAYTIDVASKLQAYALNSLSQSNDPFLRVVDRQHLESILAEQNFSLSGLIDEGSAVEVGNLTGAQAILVGQIIDHRVDLGQPYRTPVQGYESYTVKVKDSEGKSVTKTRYKQVTYYEHRNVKSVYLSTHMKLLSLETSEILTSEIIERELGDEVHWVTYSGDVSRLVPNRDGRPDTRRSAIRELKGLVEARRVLCSSHQLTNDCYEAVGDRIASNVITYLSR